MASKTGVIGKFRKDRKAFEIDDVWYSAYKAGWMNDAQSGDEVSFQYQAKGDFNNITDDGVKITEKQAAPAKTGGGGNKGKGGGSNGQFRSIPQLVRQEAVGQAITLIETQGARYSDAKQALAAVLFTANVIAAYVDGEISMDGVKAPRALTDLVGAAPETKQQVKHEAVQDPKPEVQPEPEPEPEVESPAPSLDSFLGE